MRRTVGAVAYAPDRMSRGKRATCPQGSLSRGHNASATPGGEGRPGRRVWGPPELERMRHSRLVGLVGHRRPSHLRRKPGQRCCHWHPLARRRPQLRLSQPPGRREGLCPPGATSTAAAHRVANKRRAAVRPASASPHTNATAGTSWRHGCTGRGRRGCHCGQEWVRIADPTKCCDPLAYKDVNVCNEVALVAKSYCNRGMSATCGLASRCLNDRPPEGAQKS